MKEVHLICNAHLDPIWQWDWEEGAAAAVSTFKSAADLADEFDYIFCHNEVTLYQYIEDFAPTLFDKIKELVKQGKWHIMGGWYLQPDCNMPKGESFARQILVGQKYFTEKFGVAPTTAINFDSFGHTKGLVQIMKLCGQDSYIFCRPGCDPIPATQFIWQGFSNSSVKVNAATVFYNTTLGKSAQNIRNKIDCQNDDVICVTWGVGNHGGGPSRKDLKDIEVMMNNSPEKIIHSTPERFFEKINPQITHNKSLRTVMPGCYTSQASVKQKHAGLEEFLTYTEKICTVASLKGLMEYPHAEIDEAVKDLLTIEFHDVLCGCTVKAGEANGSMMADHGLLNLNRLRAKAFFALSSTQQPAKQSEFPVLVFNPQPYETDKDVICEFMLADQNRDMTMHSSVKVTDEAGNEVPVQVIKEESNINMDWRKSIIFKAKLKPLDITRFSVWVDFVPLIRETNFAPKAPELKENIVFRNENKYVEIDSSTGLLKSFKLHGEELINGEAFKFVAYEDNEDPWAMADWQCNGPLGKNPKPFVLEKAPDGPFTGMSSVEVIEDGDILLSVECFMKYKNTRIRVEYDIYKERDYIDIKADIFPVEPNMLIKAEIPCGKSFDGSFFGQTAFGTEELYTDGRECVAQRFIGVDGKNGKVLALINKGVYGSSFKDGVISQSLIRTISYCSHPIDDLPLIPEGRYVKKADLGERNFIFRLTACNKNKLERLADEFNQQPYAVSLFPVHGNDNISDFDVSVSDESVVLITAKKADSRDKYLFRLFNGSSEKTECIFSVMGKSVSLKFNSYEVKTVSLNENGLKDELKLMI